MSKIYYSHIDLDSIENIIISLKDKSEYSCIIPYHDNASESLISRVIFKLLKQSEYEKYHQVFSIVGNELINYINKSNIKREYFTENNLNIDSSNDCFIGNNSFIETDFYNDYMSNISHKEKIHYIKIHIHVDNRCLRLSLNNGYSLTDYEYEDYQKTIAYAENFQNLNQMCKENSSITESNNFGLILTILMLKNINIKSNSIKIHKESNSTLVELIIPFSQISDLHASTITDEIIREIKELPQFPDSVLRLQKELMDPEWDYDRISDYILSDPSLTTEILRLVNSPVYRVKDKIDKISTAVKKIGIKGLKSILYNFGALEVLGNAYHMDKIKEYKEHLFQVALISSYIANFKGLNHFSEDIYVAALMHDLGKIIVNSLNPELSGTIKKLCIDRMLPTDVIDNLSEGLNHSLIGSQLSKKWDFPEKYTQAILYHHTPMLADSDYKIIVYCVYIGNEISYIINNQRTYSNINSSVLKYFDIDSEEKFTSLIKKMTSEGLFI